MRSQFILIVCFSLIPGFSWAESESLVGSETPSTLTRFLGEPPESFIGREIPPTVGCVSGSASVFDGESGSFKFAYEQLFCSGREIYLLLSFVEHRGKIAYWKVMDELRIPVLKNGRTTLDVHYCHSSKYIESEILAIGIWSKPAKDGSFNAHDISNAWRFNLQKEKIESIPTKGVWCMGVNED